MIRIRNYYTKKADQRSRCWLFIDNDPKAWALFVRALFDALPDTVCYLSDDPKEALEIMEEQRILPDYIFIDSSLPDVDGFEFLQKIKALKRLGKVPVIVHCIALDEHTIAEFRRRGAYAVYCKPYGYRGFANVLRIYLSSRKNIVSLN